MEKTMKKVFFIKKSFLFISVFLLISAFSYIYPRFLVSHFGENSPWVSYLYTYGMGCLLFGLSLLWIFSRPKVNAMRRVLEKQWTALVCFCMFFMFFLHGLWIYLAIYFPYYE